MAPQVGLETACKRQTKNLVDTAGNLNPSKFMESKELISGISLCGWGADYALRIPTDCPSAVVKDVLKSSFNFRSITLGESSQKNSVCFAGAMGPNVQRD